MNGGLHLPDCDRKILEEGVIVLVLKMGADQIDAIVATIASGQELDWFSLGDLVVIMATGDIAKVKEEVEKIRAA